MRRNCLQGLLPFTFDERANPLGNRESGLQILDLDRIKEELLFITPLAWRDAQL